MERRWPVEHIERRKVAELVPAARNARTHSPAQVDQLAASMRRFGVTTLPLVDEAGTLIAGHGRLLAFHQLGLDEAPVAVARGWTDEEKRAYRVADNKLALNADWDPELLRVELGELSQGGFEMELTGFPALELDALLGEPLASDPAEQWRSMPEFAHEDQTGKYRVIIHLADDEALADLERLLGQRINRARWACWHPEAEIGRFADKRYVVDPAGDEAPAEGPEPPVLDAAPRPQLARFLARCRRVLGDEAAREVAAAAEARLAVLGANGAGGGQPDELERRWYASLASGAPDFAIYGSLGYVAEAWACWATYARKYLRLLRDKGALGDLGPFASVADVGCGIGYSTAAFRDLFPEAAVVGTNLTVTPQGLLCADLAAERGFDLLPALDRAVDLLFASEYFEHFQAPVDHLRELLEVGRPRVVVAASTFGSPSAGHFPAYRVDGADLDGRATAAAWAAAMRDAGFVQRKTGFWNNRPSVWVRP
jgi:SAM-dependent methyltransferase